eukprot:482999-Pyramimonas_sp.AAC.1
MSPDDHTLRPPAGAPLCMQSPGSPSRARIALPRSARAPRTARSRAPAPRSGWRGGRPVEQGGVSATGGVHS